MQLIYNNYKTIDYNIDYNIEILMVNKNVISQFVEAE